MAKFYHINNLIEKKVKMMSLAEGYTPNDFKKLLVKKEFPLPTVCIIYKKGEDPFCLSQKVYDDVAECYFSEWDNVIKEDEECYFVSFPMGEVAVPLLVSLAVSLVLSVAIYLLMPRPDLPQNQVDSGSSPTYDLTNIGNKIRMNLPMPVHYGTLRFYPDICSNPYTESVNNDRFYHVLLNCGFNYIQTNEIFLDDTPLLTLSDWATYNIRYPSDPATALYPYPIISAKEVANVKIESPFASYYVLNDANNVSKVRYITFDLSSAQGAFYSGGGNTKANVQCVAGPDTDGNINLSSLPLTIDGLFLGVGDRFIAMDQTDQKQNGVYIYTGFGLAATRATDSNTADLLQLALYEVNFGFYAGFKLRQYIYKPIPATDPIRFIQMDTGTNINPIIIGFEFSIQEIDSVGANVGSPQLKYGFTFQQSRDQVFFSFTFDMGAPAKRWKATVRKGVYDFYTTTPGSEGFVAYDGNIKDANYNDNVQWVAFKGQLDFSEPTHDDLTLIEIKIQASGRLNNSNIGIFNAFGKVRIPVYDFGTSTWSTIQTNSPVWAWYDFATNKKYGAGLETSRISLANLEDISDSIAGKGIECNVRFDTASSADEVLQQIATTMRCKSYNRSGLKLLARDEEKASISAFFNVNNIIEGSISIDWRNKSVNNPQWYRITYFDETTGKKETVECVLAGTDINPDILPEELELRTITSRTKAWQEGMYFCAQNAYRREQIKFSTTMEGYIPTLFDKVSVSHPVINSYQSGKVQKVIGAVVYLDEPVYFGGYATGFISFRKKDGTSLGPYICTHGVDQYSVNLIKFTVGAPDYTLIPFFSEADEPLFDPTNFTFGVNGSSTICIVNGISPSQDNNCSVDVVTHDPRVHTADIPIRDMPPLSNGYVPIAPYICDIQEYQNPSPVAGLGCTVNLATKLITVKFNYSGYSGYRVSYLFNNLGVETSVNQSYATFVAGIKTDTYTYVGNPPSRVRVIPTIRVTDTPSIVDQELTDLTVIVPIQFV